MLIKDSYTGVMNLSVGYVSHSFMQIIRTDGKDIYRADLGDAYPREIALTRTSVEEELKNPMMYANVAAIPGEIGNNYTGYALGGLELSENNYIIAGSGIKSTTDSTANIFVNTGDKDNWNLDAHGSQPMTAAVTLFKPEPPGPETPEQSEQGGGSSGNQQDKLIIDWGNDKKLQNGVSLGDIAVVKNQKYKVTGTATVTWMGTATDSKSTISIPSSVQINGKKYQVTAISANACKNNKKLKKLVIGSGIQKIGKNAFYKTQNKIKIKIPKTKFKTYKKKLQKSKLPKKAKITS